MTRNYCALTMPLIAPLIVALTMPLIAPLMRFFASVDSPLIVSVDNCRWQLGRRLDMSPVSINGRTPETSIFEESTCEGLSTPLSTGVSTRAHTLPPVDRTEQSKRGLFTDSLELWSELHFFGARIATTIRLGLIVGSPAYQELKRVRCE